MALLNVRDLRVEFQTSEGVGRALNGVDVSVDEGQVLGIVGESGSGKSAIAMALVNLVARPGKIVSGSVRYRDRDLLRESERTLQQIRGREIGLIVQNAKSALNPLVTIGTQLVNVMRGHGTRDKAAAVEHAVRNAEEGRHSRSGNAHALLPPSAQRRHGPARHHRDGALQQSAAAHRRRTDERARRHDPGANPRSHPVGSSTSSGRPRYLITRDLGIIAQHCEEVAVLYAGQIVERAPVRAFFKRPRPSL